MCGRYNITTAPEAMSRVFGLVLSLVAAIAATADAQADDLHYDDLWFYSGPTTHIGGAGTTCESVGVCVRYCIDDQCAHGVGHLGSDGGWTYRGSFVEGYMEGVGDLSTDYYEYIGRFKGGRPHGHGVLTCFKGKSFEGDWINGALAGVPTGINRPFPLCEDS